MRNALIVIAAYMVLRIVIVIIKTKIVDFYGKRMLKLFTKLSTSLLDYCKLDSNNMCIAELAYRQYNPIEITGYSIHDSLFSVVGYYNDSPDTGAKFLKRLYILPKDNLKKCFINVGHITTDDLENELYFESDDITHKLSMHLAGTSIIGKRSGRQLLRVLSKTIYRMAAMKDNYVDLIPIEYKRFLRGKLSEEELAELASHLTPDEIAALK